MDRFSQVIIGIAISILWPALVYFGAVLIIPADTSYDTRPPSYPSCNTSYRSNNYSSSSDCERKQREYSQELNEYNSKRDLAREEENEKNIYRALLIFIVAIVTSFSSFYFKDVKELAGGLIAGSAFMLIGSSSLLATTSNKTGMAAAINTILLAGFGLLTYMIYITEKDEFNDHKNIASTKTTHSLYKDNIDNLNLKETETHKSTAPESKTDSEVKSSQNLEHTDKK